MRMASSCHKNDSLRLPTKDANTRARSPMNGVFNKVFIVCKQYLCIIIYEYLNSIYLFVSFIVCALTL